MLKDKRILKKLLEFAILIFGFGILVNLFSNKIQDKLKEIAKTYFPNTLHIDWIILISFMVVLMLIYFRFDYLFNESKETKAKKEIEDRKVLLESLELRYKKRLEKKMDSELGLTIEVALKYTKDGTTEEYLKNYFIETFQEGEAGDFNAIFKNYENNYKRLLIMGEPGSGKTVLLLNFARKLITIAKGIPDYPIPIILNLSSWRNEFNKFEDWLEQNLVYAAGQYGTSKEHARELSQSNNILLLLDGLDEIPEQHRASCLLQLQNYHIKINKERDNDYPEFIICCRREEYKLLEANAPVSASIAIEPLIPEKIYQELINIKLRKHARGNNADLLLRILREQPDLIKYLTTVFYLHIAIKLADRGFDFSKVTSQNYIIETYIKQELKSIEPQYTSTNSQKYLGWLAYNLSKSRKGIVFELTDIQPGWAGKIFLYALMLCGISFLFESGVFFLYGVQWKQALILPAVICIAQSFDMTIESDEIRKFSFKFDFLNFFTGLIALLITAPILIGLFSFFLKLKYVIYTISTVSGGLLVNIVINCLFEVRRTSLTKSAYQRLVSPFLFDFLIYIISFTPVIFLLRSGILPIKLHIPLVNFIFAPLAIVIPLASLYDHLVLRLFLKLKKLLPLKLVTFLNLTAETGLMESDGGQWRFRHQIIQDYFKNNYQRSSYYNQRRPR